MWLVMEVKVQCCKEQYCIGTWNVRSMNQGKLEVIKQENARVSINILGISELKWTGMGEFNSVDHLYPLPWARILSAKWSNPHSQKKSRKCSTWVQSQKQQNDLCSFARQTNQYQVIQVMLQPLMPKKLKLNGSMKTWRPSRTKTKKDVLCITGDWNTKVGSQGIPGITGTFGLEVQNKAGHRLTEVCQENPLVMVNTLFQYHKRQLYTWISPDFQCQNQIDYILCSQRCKSSI